MQVKSPRNNYMMPMQIDIKYDKKWLINASVRNVPNTRSRYCLMHDKNYRSQSRSISRTPLK